MTLMRQMTEMMWTTVHQIMLLKMIPEMKTLILIIKVVMVNLITLVTQANLTNLLIDHSAINNHPNFCKPQKYVPTGKQKLTNKKKQNQGSKKPFPKKNKTDGDPNKKNLQTEFVNPNQSILFIEKRGIKKKKYRCRKCITGPFFPFFLQMILLIKL